MKKLNILFFLLASAFCFSQDAPSTAPVGNEPVSLFAQKKKHATQPDGVFGIPFGATKNNAKAILSKRPSLVENPFYKEGAVLFFTGSFLNNETTGIAFFFYNDLFFNARIVYRFDVIVYSSILDSIKEKYGEADINEDNGMIWNFDNKHSIFLGYDENNISLEYFDQKSYLASQSAAENDY